MAQGTIGSVACFILLTFHHVWRVPTVEFISLLLCVGTEPFVYLGFNADIRSDFLALIRKTTKTVLLKPRAHPSSSSSRINPTNAFASGQ
uniref:Uncharacterized protein n=1 Tax=Acrobeloides nanus TaxID=290746 RepID=A0A914E8Y3_9BILA